MFKLKCFVIMAVYISLLPAQDACDSFYPSNVGDTLIYGLYSIKSGSPIGDSKNDTVWIPDAEKVAVNSMFYHEDTTFVIRTTTTSFTVVVDTQMVVSDTVLSRSPQWIKIPLYPQNNSGSLIYPVQATIPDALKSDSCYYMLINSFHPYICAYYARGYGEIAMYYSGLDVILEAKYLTSVVSACHPKIAIKRMPITPISKSSAHVSGYFNLSGQKILSPSYTYTGLLVRVSEKSNTSIINGLKQTHR